MPWPRRGLLQNNVLKHESTQRKLRSREVSTCAGMTQCLLEENYQRKFSSLTTPTIPLLKLT